MPIGIALGTAAVTAAATVGGSMLAADSQSDAVRSSNRVSQQNAAANNTFLREMYGQNAARLDPLGANGLMASNALSDLLLGSHGGTPMAATNALSPYAAGNAYRPGDTLPSGGYYVGPGRNGTIRAGNYAESGMPNDMSPNLMFPAQTGDMQSPTMDSRDTNALSMFGADDRLGSALTRAMRARAQQYRNPVAAQVPVAQQVPMDTVQASPTSALDAFARFREGTNYQWRLGQGLEALNGSLAAKGMFQSGAADKGRIEYGQNFASNELARYMDLLAGQQSMGLSASSALAGVGQNYAGNVVASNNAAAQNSANAAIARGNINGQMYGNIGSALGQLGGSIYQSSFRQPTAGADYGVLSSPIYDGVWY